MGRRRTKNRHLPARMYEDHGAFYFEPPGTRNWINLGKDLSAALAKYGQLIGPIWSGRTVHDTLMRYKTHITPLPINGRERTKEAIDNEIRTIDRFDRVFGAMHQDSLTQRHLYTYIDQRLDEREEFTAQKKAAPSAARHDVRFLKKVLNKGIKWGAGTVNAVLHLELDPDPKNDRDVTPEEYTAVRGLANERMQIAMDLASNIAQRRGDLLQIKPKRDFTDEGILIRQGKTGAALLVRWTPALRETTDRAEALKPDIPRDYLLRNRKGEKYTPRGFGANWQKLMRKALKKGVIASRFKFHDLRAKAGNDKAEATTEQEASELLGHRDLKTSRKNYLNRRPPKPKKVSPAR